MLADAVVFARRVSVPPFLRELARTVMAVSIVAPMLLLMLAQPASADWTTTVCDGQVKYWCKDVNYTPGGTVSINQRWHEGGRDGGAQWWQRWITQDWQYDAATGTWYFQKGWAPGSQLYNVALDTWDGILESRSVAAQAVVRMQNRYYECVGGECYYWCSTYIDFKLSLGTYSVGSGGRFGCLSPVY